MHDRTARSLGAALAWPAAAIAALVAGYFALAALALCWDGAYNVTRGPDPDYVSATVWVVLGLIPLAAGTGYLVAMKRGRHSAPSSLAFASLVVVLPASLVVLILRGMAGGGF